MLTSKGTLKSDSLVKELGSVSIDLEILPELTTAENATPDTPAPNEVCLVNLHNQLRKGIHRGELWLSCTWHRSRKAESRGHLIGAMLEVVGLTMGVGLLRRHLVRRVYWPEERVGGECGAADVTRNSLRREGR